MGCVSVLKYVELTNVAQLFSKVTPQRLSEDPRNCCDFSCALLSPPYHSLNWLVLFSPSLFRQTQQRHEFSNRLQSARVALSNCILLCASILFLRSQRLTLCPTIKARHGGAGGHLRLQALWEMIWASSFSQCEGLIVCHCSAAMWCCLTLAYFPQLYLKFTTHNMAVFALFPPSLNLVLESGMEPITFWNI